MTVYQRAHGQFSRTWRRNRTYTLQQLEHLADRNNARLETRNGVLTVVHAASGKLLAEYTAVPQIGEAPVVGDRIQAFAALKLPS